MGYGCQNALYVVPNTYTSSATAHLRSAFRFAPVLCNTAGEMCTQSLNEDLFFFKNSSVLHSLYMLGLIRETAMR